MDQNLNNHVSSIVDAFCKASDINHKYWQIRQLKESNHNTANTCGSCYLWMTKQCPRETKTNKVSCGQPKCEKFQIKSHYTELIGKREIEISDLEKELEILQKP